VITKSTQLYPSNYLLLALPHDVILISLLSSTDFIVLFLEQWLILLYVDLLLLISQVGTPEMHHMKRDMPLSSLTSLALTQYLYLFLFFGFLIFTFIFI
jgi:hypothetical protein